LGEATYGNTKHRSLGVPGAWASGPAFTPRQRRPDDQRRRLGILRRRRRQRCSPLVRDWRSPTRVAGAL